MECIELTERQERRALAAVDRLLEDENPVPTDYVDTWVAKPSVVNREHIGNETRFVPVEDIVGVARQNTDRLVRGRLLSHLQKMCEGEFTVRPPGSVKSPPHLEEIDGEYYVSGDGIHRTLAHKIVGVEQQWVEVDSYS